MSVPIELNFEPRKAGPKYANLARMQGLIPVVLYGLGLENENYNLDKSEFYKKVFGHETEMFNVNLGQNKNLNTVIKAQVYNSLKDEYIHLDFMRVDSKMKIEVYVPLKFVGEPLAVKISGGILNKTLDEIKVECFPEDIPSEILVDVSKLQLDEKIHIYNLEIPNNVTLLSDNEITVAVVHMNHQEEPLP